MLSFVEASLFSSSAAPVDGMASEGDAAEGKCSRPGTSVTRTKRTHLKPKTCLEDDWLVSILNIFRLLQQPTLRNSG